MNDIEIDRSLALAIGYRPEHVRVIAGCVWVHRPLHVLGWKFDIAKAFIFTHKESYTILPIMERYDCLPYKDTSEWWRAVFLSSDGKYAASEDKNPRTAAALAVIKAKEMGLI